MKCVHVEVERNIKTAVVKICNEILTNLHKTSIIINRCNIYILNYIISININCQCKSTRRKSMKYEIIMSSDLEKLESIVNEYLKDGWKCQGGIGVEATSALCHFYFLQAMIRE